MNVLIVKIIMLYKWYPGVCIHCILKLNFLFKLDHFLNSLFPRINPRWIKDLNIIIFYICIYKVLEENKCECYDDLGLGKDFLRCLKTRNQKEKIDNVTTKSKANDKLGKYICSI